MGELLRNSPTESFKTSLFNAACLTQQTQTQGRLIQVAMMSRPQALVVSISTIHLLCSSGRSAVFGTNVSLSNPLMFPIGRTSPPSASTRTSDVRVMTWRCLKLRAAFNPFVSINCLTSAESIS